MAVVQMTTTISGNQALPENTRQHGHLFPHQTDFFKNNAEEH